jgi:hypothetical protein
MACLCLRALHERFDQIYIRWDSFPRSSAYEATPAYREIDIKLGNVLDHLVLPDLVKIDKDPPPESSQCLSDCDLSGGLSLSRLGVTDPVSAKVRSLFAFTPRVLNVVAHLATEPFAAIHLRRTDKVRPIPACWSMIPSSKLDQLNSLTLQAIDHLIAAGASNFFICTDDDASLPLFVDKIRSANCRLISLPYFEKWQQTYFDLAMLCRAKAIVQSNVNSAFSNFAAFIGSSQLIRPLENVNVSVQF